MRSVTYVVFACVGLALGGCSSATPPSHVKISGAHDSEPREPASSDSAGGTELASDASAPTPAEGTHGPVLSVHVQRAPLGSVQVGWSSADKKQVGLLNPAYEAPAPTWQGPVPSAPLLIYVDGLGDNQALEAHGSIDMSSGAAGELTLALNQPRKLVTRTVVVRERDGTPIPTLRGDPVLDGTDEAMRNALLNYQQWVSDENGQLTVRNVEGAPVLLALSVPLLEQPIERMLRPDEREIVLDEVPIVRCETRCRATQKLTPYPGFSVIAERNDGTRLRYEQGESDALSGGPIIFGWPEGTRAVTVSSSPYETATITSPKQRCVLWALPARRCQEW